MTTSSTNILIDNQPENQSGFTALPSGKDLENLELGADVRNGNTSGGTPNHGGTFPNLPPKFKTVDDLVKSYGELESHLGHKNNEIGQLRSLTDKLLDLKRTEDLTKGGGRSAPVTATADELLNDPTETIRRVAADQNAPLAAELQATRLALAEQQFENKHNGFKQTMQTPEFQNFVRASQYRTRLAMQAAQNGDFGAADELFTAWSEHAAATRAASTQQGNGQNKDNRDEALRAAAMVSGGGTDTSGSAGGKPVYSRRALIEKRIKDPNGYYDEGFQSLIMQAYAEGRVK